MGFKSWQEIIADAKTAQTALEAPIVTDIPLGARAPAKLTDIEMITQAQAANYSKSGPKGKIRPAIDMNAVEPIRKSTAAYLRAEDLVEVEAKAKAKAIEDAKPKRKTQEDYYRIVRRATRRPTGKDPISAEDRARILTETVENICKRTGA